MSNKSNEKNTKDTETALDKSKELAAADSKTTSPTILVDANQTQKFQAILADPTYSGMGTWIGTIISIIAAFVAFKQARAAISIVGRVKQEQKRKYVESAQRAITNLDDVVKPIVVDGVPVRGLKISAIINSAINICHGLLSSPVDEVLPCIPISIKNIEDSLEKISAAIDAAKGAPPTPDPLRDIQRSIRTEIQSLSRACMMYLDQNAAN